MNAAEAKIKKVFFPNHFYFFFKFHFVFIENNDNIVELSLNAPIKSAEDYQLPKNLKKWKHGNLKGAFYLKHTSNSIFTNSYILNLKEDSEVHFEINPYETSMNKSNF